MGDEPMDGFEARLVSLMTAYGDRAVTAFDAAAIAHLAVSSGPPWRSRIAVPVGTRMRIGLMVALVALLAVALAVAAGSRHASPIGDLFAAPTTAAWSPDGGTLALVVDVADGGVAAGPGGSRPGISGATAAIGRPSHPELWVVNGDGGDPRHLATLGPTPAVPQLAWTQDGRSIVVGGTAANGTGHSVILSVGLDGSAPTTLLDAGVDLLSFIGLSPAGDRLLYFRSGGSTGLYVLDLARRAATRLADARSGSWSTDGRWVEYMDGQGLGSTTWIVASDGSVRHRLGPGEAEGWSADGSRAYFQTEDGPMDSAAVDGTDVRLEPGLDATYGWARSPDGSRYVAVTPRGLQIQRPGAAPVELTSDPSDSAPTWSPDGTWIAFEGVRARTWVPFEGVARTSVAGLYVVPATGGAARLVVPDAAALGYPWRSGAGRTELTLVRDRAIVEVAPDGGGLRELLTRTAIAGDPLIPPAATGQQARIVLGPTGPDRDIYHIATRLRFQVDVENRSDIAWVPWGLAEKESYCHPVSGPAYSADPCTVGPHQVVRFAPSEIFLGRREIRIAPEGADPSAGFPVILDLEPPP